MISFGGFEMPVQYTDIADEHTAVRTRCGVFDVSHMGEIMVWGPEAERFVQHIFTNDVAAFPAGETIYGMMLHPDGGTIDDIMVYKEAADRYFIVVNAGTQDKDYAWIEAQARDFDVRTENQSARYGQLAVQGPESETVLLEVLGMDCREMLFRHFKRVEWIDGRSGQGDKGSECVIISRTGYTGEDGFEIFGSHDFIRTQWDRLMESHRVAPCGLGCRDTLRFEAGLPLYGHELSDEISPIEAGLGMFVKPEKGDFVGRDVVARQKSEGTSRRIVGIELEGRAIPRSGYEVLAADEVVGTVTTGYASISTGKSICMALVRADVAAMGTPLSVRIHRKVQAGKVVSKRFYKTSYHSKT